MSRRWFCGACLREWLFAYHWTAEQGCPTCQSSNIREIEYRPAFLGADLPRDAHGYPVTDGRPGIVADAVKLTVLNALYAAGIDAPDTDSGFEVW